LEKGGKKDTEQIQCWRAFEQFIHNCLKTKKKILHQNFCNCQIPLPLPSQKITDYFVTQVTGIPEVLSGYKPK